MVVDIQKEISDLYFKAFVKFDYEHNKDRTVGFHVSAASYGCARKIFYDLSAKKNEEYEGYQYWQKDAKGLYKISLGSKLHEVPLTDDSEHDVSYKTGVEGLDIYGSIDEIFTDSEGGKWIVDKKYVGFAPNYLMKPEHRKQVGYYSWLYKQQTGTYAKGIILAYFVVKEIYFKNYDKMEIVLDENVTKYHVEELTPDDIDGYGKELMAMVMSVKQGKDTNTPPDKTISWYCGYCKFGGNCFEGRTQEEIRKSINSLS